MAWLLVVVFVVVPIAEIAVIVEVGKLIGPVWTVGLLLASALVGSWMLRREGRRAWRAFQDALAARRVPTREVADGALVILGGALMITPGFISDAVGMLCLLPPTRSVLRRLLVLTLTRRAMARATGARRVRSRRGAGRPYQPPPAPPGTRDHPVIEGEVEP